MDVELCVRILCETHKYKKRGNAVTLIIKYIFTTYYGNECP